MGSILFDLEVNTWVYALVTLPNGNFVSGSSETSINTFKYLWNFSNLKQIVFSF